MSLPAKNYGVWSATQGWLAGYNRNTMETVWSRTAGAIMRFDFETATEIASCKKILGSCAVKYNPKTAPRTEARAK